MAILIAVLVAWLVFGTVVTVFVVHNGKLADKAHDLQRRKEAARLLGHALKYLSTEGAGFNLEWTNARCIIENALLQVLYEK